jgi:transposase
MPSGAKEDCMLTISGAARVFLYGEPVNMHMSFEGLSVIVEKFFDVEITSGAYFVFLNRQRDRMKVIYWDVDGLAIWYKRLERGTFSSKSRSTQLMPRREFLMLLEGVIPKRINRRYKAP